MSALEGYTCIYTCGKEVFIELQSQNFEAATKKDTLSGRRRKIKGNVRGNKFEAYRFFDRCK